MSTSFNSLPVVLTHTYRNHECVMQATDTGWTIHVEGKPILFDLIHCDWTPAFAWVDLKLAMAGNGLPSFA